MFRRRTAPRDTQSAPPLDFETEDHTDDVAAADTPAPPVAEPAADADTVAPPSAPSPAEPAPLRPLARPRMPAASTPAAPGPAAMNSSPPSTGFRPEVARRIPDLPGMPSRRRPGELGGSDANKQQQPPQRILSVGRDISLSGEINACDQLVVEGEIQAKLNDCRIISVSPGGVFRGSAEVEEADIGGLFDGDLVVRGRLTVRSGGKVQGTLRYGELEVEAGGKLTGSIEPIEDVPPASATVTPIPEPADRPRDSGALDESP